jgi:hypothetical protein
MVVLLPVARFSSSIVRGQNAPSAKPPLNLTQERYPPPGRRSLNRYRVGRYSTLRRQRPKPARRLVVWVTALAAAGRLPVALTPGGEAMKQPRQRRRAAVAGFASVIAAGTLAGPALAGTNPAPGPAVKLIAAQHSITVPSYRGQVLLDAGIWVAALGSALQFDVQRVSYTKPVTIAQIIHTPWGTTQARPLPATVLDGWNGLKHFIQMTVRNRSGKVVISRMLTFCPNTYNPERASPHSPVTSPYPQECGFDPFPLSMVWGVAKGWATDPAQSYPPSPLGPGPFVRLRPGSYRVTETITPGYTRLLRIPSRDATSTVQVTVVKGRGCCGTAAGRRTYAQDRALPSLPQHVPYLANPPQAALPDLTPLPSWGISTSHTRTGRDLLNFGATVWVGGNSPLDVEGFRSNSSPIMKAYQYFWRDGHVIGRVRAGTMGFDSQHGHNHWHFEQFARYQLLDSARKLAVRSHKQGFCIGPSDPVDLLAPHAAWQPPVLGLGGQCGAPTALWVQEMMPVGWGDTYFQSVAGQSFDISSLPDGTYYIEVIANPQRVLHELNTGNDVSLRKVILGGTPGHRTVKVPAWHGIDPEG